MTATSSSLRGFPARIGQLLIAPRAGVARVEADGGGLRDALWLVVLGVLTFRLPELFRLVLATAGPNSGVLGQLVGLFVNEARNAAWVVLPAAVIITVAAGGRRDAARDLDLGAACYAPYFVLRSIARLLGGVTGLELVSESRVALLSGIGVVFVLAQAIRAARTRGNHTPGEVAAMEPGRRGLLAGLGVLGLLAVTLGANVVWSMRHYDALRPIRRGEPAPPFTLPDIDHADTVSLEKLRGQVVLLDFWATWCSPCVAMLPVMDATHKSWASRGVAFVGINSDGGGSTLNEIKSFLAEHPIPYPVVVDDGSVGALYKVEALPSLVVIGRDGRIRQSFVGYTTERALDRALADATRD